MTEQREPGSQHPAQPRTAAGRALVEWAHNAFPEQEAIWLEHALLIEAEAAAPTPAEQSRLDHEKINRMRGGLHLNSTPAPTPAEPLDVLRQELADMEAVGWPATSHEYRRGVHYAIERLAAARREAH